MRGSDFIFEIFNQDNLYERRNWLGQALFRTDSEQINIQGLSVLETFPTKLERTGPSNKEMSAPSESSSAGVRTRVCASVLVITFVLLRAFSCPSIRPEGPLRGIKGTHT